MMISSAEELLFEHTNAAIHIIEPKAEAKRSMAIALHQEQDLPTIMLTMSSNFEDFMEKQLHPNEMNIVIVDWRLTKVVNGAMVYDYAKRQDKNVKMVFYCERVLGPPSFFEEIGKVANENMEFVPKSGGLNLLAKIVFSMCKVPAETKLAENFVVVQNDVKVVSLSLVEALARNPKLMYELNPRKFEELIAELFDNEGYEVELTGITNDAGKDIYAVKRDAFGKQLLAIECKRYNAKNKVGRPLLQNLYGVVTSENLTGGILVTSSFFTRPAKSFQETVANRLFLSDYYDLQKLLKKHKKP